jgi:hypothetical protein
MGIERGRAIGMPLAEFVEQAWSQLAAGSEQVTVGADEDYMKLMDHRRNRFEAMSDMFEKHLAV